MPKPTQGARSAAGKKKTKKRPESRPVAQMTASTSVSTEPVQAEENGNGHTDAPVLQFRPKAREVVPARASSARGGTAARAAFQTMDYSYVYTDLRVIGVLMASLLVMLIALTFVIR